MPDDKPARPIKFTVKGIEPAKTDDKPTTPTAASPAAESYINELRKGNKVE